MLENNYWTFSLNNPIDCAIPTEFGSLYQRNNNLALINNSSYRNTEIEENQSYQKQVTGAFNNQFTSFDEKTIQKATTSEFKQIDGNNRVQNRHQELDDFINAPDGQD